MNLQHSEKSSGLPLPPASSLAINGACARSVFLCIRRSKQLLAVLLHILGIDLNIEYQKSVNSGIDDFLDFHRCDCGLWVAVNRYPFTKKQNFCASSTLRTIQCITLTIVSIEANLSDFE
jgi:hypothetical protein